ncbi:MULTISPECIES: hypothetical protein [Burkholderia]|uniref:hypothetical protein n=1 Tax=Burkholderia TaxID=32008 RepID=UPI001269C238|nr:MULTISPECIES: hypothetical protein [Burkholderia]
METSTIEFMNSKCIGQEFLNLLHDAKITALPNIRLDLTAQLIEFIMKIDSGNFVFISRFAAADFIEFGGLSPEKNMHDPTGNDLHPATQAGPKTLVFGPDRYAVGTSSSGRPCHDDRHSRISLIRKPLIHAHRHSQAPVPRKRIRSGVAGTRGVTPA